MDIGKVLGPVFTAAIIGIIYIIIFLALRIMYKDIKSGERKRRVRKDLGLEILSPGENSSLRKGGIIPVSSELTLGRKEDNDVVLTDPYVSGHHAKIYVKNTDLMIEDLGSTNGSLLNKARIEGRELLNPGDEIRIGSAVFKVID